MKKQTTVFGSGLRPASSVARFCCKCFRVCEENTSDAPHNADHERVLAVMCGFFQFDVASRFNFEVKVNCS